MRLGLIKRLIVPSLRAGMRFGMMFSVFRLVFVRQTVQFAAQQQPSHSIKIRCVQHDMANLHHRVGIELNELSVKIADENNCDQFVANRYLLVTKQRQI
jgi:hypothetical protein